MAKKETILLVEDDTNFGLVLKNYLELGGYTVVLSRDGGAGWRDFNEERHYDLCILDVMMPIKDGFSLAADIKKVNPGMPLIFLTAKALKEDQLKGYKLGADDYIVKPFDSELLLFKIKAVLGRNAIVGLKEEAPSFQIGTLNFDFDTRELFTADHKFTLSPKEAQLLNLLCQNMGRVTPKDEALLKIWKDDSYFTGRSMDVYITKLRKYLSLDPDIKILNVHGSGFRLTIKEKGA